MTLYGASEEAARPREGLVPPRPASGHSTEGRDALTQVLLRLGVSSEGLPLRMGLRDGNTSDRTEPPVAMEECVALASTGSAALGPTVRPMVNVRGDCAWRSGWGSSPWCRVRVRCARRERRGAAARGVARMARKTWADPSGAVAMLAWTTRVRRVSVADADGRLDAAERRCLVVHSSQGAQQAATAYAAAPATEAERVAEPLQRVEARGWPVRPTPRRPAAPMQAGGRDGGAARRVSGALSAPLPVEAVSPPKRGRGAAVRRRPRPPRARSALAWSCAQRPCSPLKDAYR